MQNLPVDYLTPPPVSVESSTVLESESKIVNLNVNIRRVHEKSGRLVLHL